MSITKAIIPVAGWGTRRLPITKAIEKCMLPVGNRPIVDYVVQDCIKAGIKDIYFVVSEGSTQLQAYYGVNQVLDEYLVVNKKEDKLPLTAPPAGINFHYIEQPSVGRYGTAVPVSLAVSYLNEGESAVVVTGDDFIFNKDGSSEVARLLEITPENGCSMLCARVDRDEVGRYGVVEMTDQNEYVRIVEHPDPETTPSTLINISKYVMNYELMQTAKYVRMHSSGEYYIIDAMNQYVESGGKINVLAAQGAYLDGGSVEGWLNANQVVLHS